MEKLYDYNHLPEYWKICDDQPFTGTDKHNIHNWGGPLARRAALAIYTVMFVCLLRVDEALKIRMEHIAFEDRKVILTLPFRKTHQFGGKPSSSFTQAYLLYSFDCRHQALRSPPAARGGSLPVPSTCSCRLDFRKWHHFRVPFSKNCCWWPPICTRLSYGKYRQFITLLCSHTPTRHRSNALKCSGITSLTLAFTHPHMAPTHSGAADANGLPLFDVGSFDEYAIGADGVQSFRVLQLSSIWSPGMMIPRKRETIFLILIRLPLYSATTVVDPAHVRSTIATSFLTCFIVSLISLYVWITSTRALACQTYSHHVNRNKLIKKRKKKHMEKKELINDR